MSYRLLIACSLSLAISAIANAQNPDEHKIGYYIDKESGKLYWNKRLGVYLRIASSPDDEGILLKSENHEQYANPLYFDTEGINFVRKQHAVNKETMKQENPLVEILFEVYADGYAPVSRLSLNNAPVFTSNGVRYFGKGLSYNIRSVDQLSGVKGTYHNLNKAGYTPFSQAAAIDKEGVYELSYYSADMVGNVETPQTETFTVDLTHPNTYHNINGITGSNVLSPTSKIYLLASDEVSGVNATYYKIDDGDFQKYNGREIPTTGLDDGDHVLTYYSVDNVQNREGEKTFTFYLDKTAPITAADILGDRFIANGKVYFSGRTKLKLTAVDNKSGVKAVLYSVDSEPFKTYDQPFYLPSISGDHEVRYYSIDNTENQTADGKGQSGFESFKHSVSKVYVDLTGPSLQYAITGSSFKTRDTVFVNARTKIQLKGSDGESGLQKITYSLDGNPEELEYSEPFSIPQAGYHKIEYFGYDNVNNRNVDQFYFVTDNEAPTIIQHFSIAPLGKKEGLDVYPSYVVLFLAATDRQVGYDRITYRINGGAEKPFTGPVSGFSKNQLQELTIRAIDKLGNASETIVKFYTAN